MTLQERIQTDIAGAMRSKETLKLNVLRMMKSAIKNREIEKMKALDEAEALTVLNTLVKQRRESIDQFRKGGREDLAEKETAEIGIIEEYLPASASDEEISQAVVESLRETGASSMRDMGKVMSSVKAKLSNKTLDGAKVSQLVKEKLGAN